MTEIAELTEAVRELTRAVAEHNRLQGEWWSRPMSPSVFGPPSEHPDDAQWTLDETWDPNSTAPTGMHVQTYKNGRICMTIEES